MCKPLSHDSSPSGGGAACGRSRVTELVTARLSAGWLEISPAWLVTTDNATISAAAAMVVNIFPVPPNASQNQRSDPIASSFESETFARLSPDRRTFDRRLQTDARLVLRSESLL